MKVNKRMIAGDLDLIRFMFPEYKLTDGTENIDGNKFLFIGSLSDIDRFKEVCDAIKADYIVYTNGLSDINLRDRTTLANIVFDKYNRLVPKYLMEIINDLDEDIFIKNIKTYWVSGKWLDKKIDNEDTFLTFVDTVNRSSMEMYKVFFNVVDSIKPYKLASSFMTFLNRAKDGNIIDVNYHYRNKLKLFEKTKIKRAALGLRDSIEYNIDNTELRLLTEIIKIMEYKNKNLTKM